MLLHIGICDDEMSILQELDKIVKDVLDRESIPYTISLYPNGREMLGHPQHLDIAFLDIDMPELDGIQTAKALRARSLRTKIIFVTGLSDKKDAAFGVHAFSYVVKPFDSGDIERQLLDAYRYMESQGKRPELSFICANGDAFVTDEDDVIYLESVNRHTQIVTRSGKYQLIMNLKKIRPNLNPFYFTTPHSSFCVNMLHVKQIKGYQLFMDNGDVLPIAQKKSSEFRDRLFDFLHKTYFLK